MNIQDDPRAPIVCPECKGRGRFFIEDEESETYDYDIESCANCDGSGTFIPKNNLKPAEYIHCLSKSCLNCAEGYYVKGSLTGEFICIRPEGHFYNSYSTPEDYPGSNVCYRWRSQHQRRIR